MAARAEGHGRATIPLRTYVRLMVVKHRYGWGYETLAEGRISHLKRRHRPRRSRLKGGDRQRTWTGSAVFAHNVETYGRYA